MSSGDGTMLARSQRNSGQEVRPLLFGDARRIESCFRLAVIAIYFVVVLAVPAPASSVDCVDYGRSLHWQGAIDMPGECYDVAAVGHYGYVANFVHGLRVIDVSNPQDFRVVANLDLPGDAWGVASNGILTCIAADQNGLHLVDVSDPTNPQLVSTANTPGAALGVALSGSYAYVADWSRGLQVIDVSAPNQPVIVGHTNTPGNSRDVVVVGRYAFVADDTEGLQIIDIAEPAAPILVGGIRTPGRAFAVAADGMFAYVGASHAGVHVVDVSNPARPSLVATIDTPGDAVGVAIDGAFVFVGDGAEGLQVIDVSSPNQPRIVGNSKNRSRRHARGIAIFESTAYVADGTRIQVIDVSSPFSVPVLGRTETRRLEAIAMAGAFACVVGDNTTGVLTMIDVTTKDRPSIVGSLDLDSGARDVTVVASWAYVANNAGLRIVDISEPSSPTVVGSLDTSSRPLGVAVVGQYAYLTNADNGLQIIDVSDPVNPLLVGSVDTPGTALDVFVSPPYAYIADSRSGLHVVDIADPTAPRIVASIDTPGRAYEVIVAETYAYVADHNAGLQVIDVSNPLSPMIVGALDTPVAAFGIELEAPFVYMADVSAGLQVIDVSIPTHPTFQGSADVAEGTDVVIDGPYAYVAASPRDFLVVPTHCRQVSVEVENFGVDTGESNVTLRWQLSAATTRALLGVTVQRKSALGRFEDLSTLLRPSETMHFVDNHVTPGERYSYRLLLTRKNGSAYASAEAHATVGSQVATTDLALCHRLCFDSRVEMRYTTGSPGAVELVIFDVLGRRVWDRSIDVATIGQHVSVWDRRNRAGSQVSRGVYFVQLRAAGVTASRRLTLLGSPSAN